MSEEEKDLINLKIAISPEKYIEELLKENQQLKEEKNVQKEMIENFIKENQELKDKIKELVKYASGTEMSLGEFKGFYKLATWKEYNPKTFNEEVE